jgi:transposase
MRFYTNQHQFYCGIDLHAKKMYLCVLDSLGNIVLHRNMNANAEALVQAIAPFDGTDLVIAVECIFSWYWVADFCAQRNIPFVLGHALYMKAIHGSKTKNDKIDSRKIAMLLRAGMLPQAYVYPARMRATRDLLRRREYFMHKQAEILEHIQNTNTQYNLDPFPKRIRYPSNRTDIAAGFPDPMVSKSIEVDVLLLDAYHGILRELEAKILCQARHHDPDSLAVLHSVPGIGKILSLTILYEVQDIKRFPSGGDFISYARLVKCAHESAGKRTGGKNNKIGNAHLKWAFSEAAVLFLRGNEPAKRLHQKLVGKYGKAKALSIIAQKLGRVVYYMLKRKMPFDPVKFFQGGVHESVA